MRRHAGAYSRGVFRPVGPWRRVMGRCCGRCERGLEKRGRYVHEHACREPPFVSEDDGRPRRFGRGRRRRRGRRCHVRRRAGRVRRRTGEDHLGPLRHQLPGPLLAEIPCERRRGRVGRYLHEQGCRLRRAAAARLPARTHLSPLAGPPRPFELSHEACGQARRGQVRADQLGRSDKGCAAP